MPSLRLPITGTYSFKAPTDGRVLFSDENNNGNLSAMSVTGSIIDLEGGSGGGGGADLIVKDEGILLTSAATELDFIGDGVSANNSGDQVTISIPGAGVTTATTNTIDFTTRKVYYTDSSPTSGTMSADFTNAKLGVVQKIYHNDTSLTLDGGATWVLMGDAVYLSGLNIVYAEWTGGTRIEYWITQ